MGDNAPVMLLHHAATNIGVVSVDVPDKSYKLPAVLQVNGHRVVAVLTVRECRWGGERSAAALKVSEISGCGARADLEFRKLIGCLIQKSYFVYQS